MHDKAVRRRRAVLAALVVLSLFLLTAYFGESKSGPLHAVQRTTMEILAPIQEGANRALKPFRDLFGWFGDTLDAKEERDRAIAERDRLRKQLAEVTLENRELEQLKGLEQINGAGGLDDYEPVTARVIARSPSSWYQTYQINKGSSDGVRVDQPVVNSAGLVGKVKEVSDGNAVVMLLSDEAFGVSARALEADQPGIALPIAGSRNELLFDLVPQAKKVREGDRIVTAGTITEDLPSPFPPDILIGTVRKVEGEGELERQIHVKPAADLRNLDFVRVLTKPAADSLASTTP